MFNFLQVQRRGPRFIIIIYSDDDDVKLYVLECRLTYLGQVVTSGSMFFMSTETAKWRRTFTSFSFKESAQNLTPGEISGLVQSLAVAHNGHPSIW